MLQLKKLKLNRKFVILSILIIAFVIFAFPKYIDDVEEYCIGIPFIQKAKASIYPSQPEPKEYISACFGIVRTKEEFKKCKDLKAEDSYKEEDKLELINECVQLRSKYQENI